MTSERERAAVREIRRHDERIYVQEDRYDSPKEYFKVLFRMADAAGALATGSRVLDVGCATGEFLYFLSQTKSDVRYAGIDIHEEFRNKAASRVPGVDFRLGSILDAESVEPASFDTVFVLGVLSIFHDFRPALRNVLSWCRPGGHVYVFGLVNPYPVDVWTTYRRAEDLDEGEVETGWNSVSRVSFSRFLDEEIGVGRHSFTPFEMPFDLPPHADDPIRSWTFRDANGRCILTNGLGLLQNLEILEIHR